MKASGVWVWALIDRLEDEPMRSSEVPGIFPLFATRKRAVAYQKEHEEYANDRIERVVIKPFTR